jgi:hypothetical protein
MHTRCVLCSVQHIPYHKYHLQKEDTMYRIDDISCPLDCTCPYCGNILMCGESAAQWAADDGETIMAYWHAECADRQEELEAEDALNPKEFAHNPEAEARVDLMFRRLHHDSN